MIGETFKRQMKSRRLFFAFSMRESINIRPTEDNYGLSIIFVCVSFTEDFIQTRIKTTSWSLHLNCPRCEDWQMCEIDLLQNPFQRTLQIIKECIPGSGTGWPQTCSLSQLPVLHRPPGKGWPAPSSPKAVQPNESTTYGGQQLRRRLPATSWEFKTGSSNPKKLLQKLSTIGKLHQSGGRETNWETEKPQYRVSWQASCHDVTSSSFIPRWDRTRGC